MDERMDESSDESNKNIIEPGFRNGSSSCEEDDEERKDLIPPSSPPKDKYNMIYIIMFILALGVLFPYQSFVAGLDYFTYLYPSYKSELALPLSNILAALFSITVSIGIINYLSISFRLNVGYVIFIICLSTVLLLDIGINNCMISTEAGFTLTVLSVLLSGFGGGIQQSTLYGISGMLPERFTQCLMFGEAAAGSIVAINRIITKGSSGSERTGTLIFFSISLLFIIVCVGLQFVLWKSPFVKYYLAQNTSKENKRFELNCRSMKSFQCLKRRHSDDIQLEDIPLEKHIEQEKEEEEEEKEDATSKYKFKNHLIDGLVFRYRILKKIWQPFVSVFLIFFVTLLVFPSITSDVQYCKIGDWPIVIHTSLFSFADTIGRGLCLLPYRVSPKSLLIISILRFLLVPLLILCVTPSPTNPIFSPPFNLVVSVITVTVLAGTNGYFGTLGMQYAPNVVSNNEKELTGGMMILTLLGGLFVGSVVAYIWIPLMSLDTYVPCASTNDTAFFKCL